MKAMGALLDQNVMTVTGHNLAENLKEADIFSSDIIRPLTHPVHPYGGIAILKGNLAPRGAVIKQVALKESLWTFSGPARVFDSEEDALAGLGSGKVKAGEVVVIRYEGPIGGPGMREMALSARFPYPLGIGEAYLPHRRMGAFPVTVRAPASVIWLPKQRREVPLPS